MASESRSSDVQLADGGGARRLLSVSFVGLLITQFLGAANDNILRWLVIGLGKQFVSEDRISWILAMGSACRTSCWPPPRGISLTDSANKR